MQKKNKKLMNIIGMLCCSILYFIVGVLAHIAYLDYVEEQNLKKIINSNNSEYLNILDGQWRKDITGDWVCVNIKDMSYERAFEVCSHEVGHEIFAEECEKNPKLCFDLLNELKKDG